MLRFARSQHFKAFSPAQQAAYTLPVGTRATVEVYCASTGAIDKEVQVPVEHFFDEVGWKPGIPATGPIAIPGAEPGDVLAVHIHEVSLDATGWTAAIPGMGALADQLVLAESKLVPISNEHAEIAENFQVPIEPMVGLIGTTPADSEIATRTPGEHGGNMDCRTVQAGTIVYLPVLIPQANLGVGDLHALMGDGEVGAPGIEIGGSVTLSVELLRGLNVPLPFIENATHVMTVHSQADLRAATLGAVRRMADFLVDEVGATLNQANWFMSVVGSLRICQIVNPFVTARMEIPKTLLSHFDCELIALRDRYRVVG